MKKGMLALLITPMVLLSLVGCGGQKGDSTSSSTSSSPVSSSVSTPVSSSTSVAAVEMGVGDALKAAVGTKVSVSGRVLAVTQQHLVIGDTTGIMLAYLGADYTITNSVDDHVKIEGVLTSFNNRNQFDSTCTIETLTTDAPVVDKTVTPWGVTDVSVSSVTNYLNILVESGEEVAYSAVESISIAEDSKTLVVGSSAVIEAKVLPVMADGSVAWESLNPDIVSVEDGVVKAIKAGTATVKATSVGLTSASVTVSDTIEITVSDALATQSETYTWVTSDPKLEAKEDGVYAIDMDHFELLWLPSTTPTNIATAEMRLYKNATLKISSKAGEKIAKIVIHTTGAAQYTVSCVASGVALDGSEISTIVEDMNKSAKTLTYDVAGAGYASSVSIKTANGQIRISSIEFFYA